MIKILKITSLPTIKNPKSGLHVIESSPLDKKFSISYIKLNKGEIIDRFKNSNIYEPKKYFRIFEIIRNIIIVKPDIISIHNYKFFLIPVIIKLITVKKIKFIYTFHGQDKRLISKSKLIHFLFKLLYNKLLTLDYQFSKKFKINFFPNGYDVLKKNELKDVNSSFDILFPASFKPVKNHHLFILFAEKYFMNIPKKVRIFFAGDGSLKKKYLEICKKSSNKNIEYHFLGSLSTYELDKYYKSSSICILPSKNEAFSKVVIECIQNNILLITTRVGSNEYILGENYKYFISNQLNKNDFNIFLEAFYNYTDFQYESINIKSWKVIRNDYRFFYCNLNLSL